MTIQKNTDIFEKDSDNDLHDTESDNEAYTDLNNQGKLKKWTNKYICALRNKNKHILLNKLTIRMETFLI